MKEIAIAILAAIASAESEPIPVDSCDTVEPNYCYFDWDCQGMRFCISGTCYGESGCNSCDTIESGWCYSHSDCTGDRFCNFYDNTCMGASNCTDPCDIEEFYGCSSDNDC